MLVNKINEKKKDGNIDLEPMLMSLCERKNDQKLDVIFCCCRICLDDFLMTPTVKPMILKLLKAVIAAPSTNYHYYCCLCKEMLKYIGCFRSFMIKLCYLLDYSIPS